MATTKPNYYAESSVYYEGVEKSKSFAVKIRRTSFLLLKCTDKNVN
jgi:hypothetical protein